MARADAQAVRSMAVLVALASVPPVWGADGPVALEEIIVTATRRESALMQTPAAVSAFDSAMRAQLNIQNNIDLQARTPSLTVTSFRVSIRGVGRPNLAIGSEPRIGVYWDGVYNTENGVFNDARFLDIECIEVVRDPQLPVVGQTVDGALQCLRPGPGG